MTDSTEPASRKDDPANPFEPGDPFRRRNFSKFALGLMLVIALFVAAMVVFLLFFGKKSAPAAPSPQHSAFRLPQHPAARVSGTINHTQAKFEVVKETIHRD